MPAEKTNGAGKFDTGLIRELAAILREANLGEIEVQQGDLRIKVAKSEPQAIAYAPQGYAPAPAAAPSTTAAPAGGKPAAAAPSAADEANTVKSPMVGTVYLQPEKDAPSFVKVGDTVSAGAVLLLIEAMKTFNQVAAPKAGKVKAILVANEQPVEFGEPLIVIE
jgi:acetyl-CoA carboxylase biotin carboxyl carrier protein